MKHGSGGRRSKADGRQVQRRQELDAEWALAAACMKECAQQPGGCLLRLHQLHALPPAVCHSACCRTPPCVPQPEQRCNAL